MRRLLALTLMACGIAWTAMLVTQVVVESHATAQSQQRLMAEVPSGHVRADDAAGTHRAARARPVGTGDALLVMRIPRLGPDWRWVALEGTAPAVLADGPGHYSGTPLPGARGNTSFAAHRAGHGDPFIDFDRLQPGDRVVLRQGAARWVYTLDTAPRVIAVTASWVLDPTPGRRLTLTTCWPKYGSSQRMFVRGHLTDA